MFAQLLRGAGEPTHSVYFLLLKDHGAERRTICVPPIRLEVRSCLKPSRLLDRYATMPKSKKTSEPVGWERELELLESLRWSRKEFVVRVCATSKSQDERVLSVLRLEAAYQLVEFYFLLQARGIETDEDIRRLAELHNQYPVDIMRDAAKMERLGLNRERALEAMFTASAQSSP